MRLLLRPVAKSPFRSSSLLSLPPLRLALPIIPLKSPLFTRHSSTSTHLTTRRSLQTVYHLSLDPPPLPAELEDHLAQLEEKAAEDQYDVEGGVEGARGQDVERGERGWHVDHVIEELQKAEGEEVEEGEILGYMKVTYTLRSPIRSPCSGTVQTLLCSENQRVQKGDDLVAIVSTEDADNDDGPPDNNAGLLVGSRMGGGRTGLEQDGRQFGVNEEDGEDDEGLDEEEDDEEEEDEDEDDDDDSSSSSSEENDDLARFEEDEDDFSADDADLLPPGHKARALKRPSRRNPISHPSRGDHHLLEDDEIEEDRLDHVMEIDDNDEDREDLDEYRDRWSELDGNRDGEGAEDSMGGRAVRAETGFDGDDAFLGDEENREDDRFLNDGESGEGGMVEESEGGAEGVVRELEGRDGGEGGGMPSGRF